MARAPLGRGLAALIPDEVLHLPEVKAPGGIRKVRLDQIRPNPEQPRITFSEGALEQLAESIRSHGVITPLLVRRDDRGQGYVLIAGERRLRASGLAGLEEVPVFIRDDVDGRDQLELALVENIQREDLDPIETAQAYHRLVDEFGLTQAEVARRVGKDRATVANAIRLLKLPDFALSELRTGRISAGHGKALLALSDDEQLRRALTEVLEKDLSVRATERLCSTLLRAGGGARKNPANSPLALRLGEQLTRSLGTKVKVEPRARGQRGRIVIDYFSREELDRLMERFGNLTA
jgi:ParB family chromosome partitioning protein